MEDPILESYREDLINRTDLRFPKFAQEAVHTAPILAVLDTPGPGAVERCSLDNRDGTSRRQRRVMSEVGVERERVIFWNFFAAYDGERDRRFWAGELERLINLLPNIRAVMVFGDDAWRGMRDVELPNGVTLIGAPHPSDQSCNPNPEAEPAIKCAWQRAKRHLDCILD